MREVRSLFEAAVHEEKLDPEILDVIWFGMKSRWVEHLSMESSAAFVLQSDAKALPKDEISFSVSLPFPSSHTLFKASTPGAVRPLFQFSLCSDGKLSIISNAIQEGKATFSAAKVRKGRWAHLAFLWYLRSTHPNLSECSY